MKTILWFRRDLRLQDNPALNWACKHSATVIPVYIHAPEEEQPWAPGAASRWWLHNSLAALEKQLQEYGLKLQYFSGSSEHILKKIIRTSNADALVFNKLYEPHLSQRDSALTTSLQKQIDVSSFDSGLFFKPGSVLNGQQLPYRMFTPFAKKIWPLLSLHYDHYTPGLSTTKLSKLSCEQVDFASTLDQLALLDAVPWHEKLHAHWQPGESTANKLIKNFLHDAVAEYKVARDVPAMTGTSCMSPHLHFGEITPQLIYSKLLPLLGGEAGARTQQSAEVYLKQLLWREFANHILWHFPHTQSEPMNARYKKSFWQRNNKHFTAWCQGETGIPIVDAGMKQLWQTGWMHNRVRMIVSSFLTKNLGISWTQGANWFWDTLVDANLANNTMGWQWVAGCGVDAAPYYRIFNPITQAKRFDAKQDYINQWAPEYTSLLQQPDPIVDVAHSRHAALERYKQYVSG